MAFRLVTDPESSRSEWLERRKNSRVILLLNIYEKSEMEPVVLNPEKPQDIADSKRLTAKLKKDPSRYLKARLQIGSDRCRTTYAVIPDKGKPDIQVKGSIKQAFSGDTVVIDLKPNSLAIEGNVGYFIGVLNRFADPCERQYVCEVNPKNPSVMVPIDRSLPRILNKKSNNKTAGNTIPIYERREHGVLQEISKLSLQDALNKKCLFVVEFLKWDKDHRIPLGCVTRTIPRDESLKMSKRILLIELGIQENFTCFTPEMLRQFIPEAKEKVKRELPQRRRVSNAFTIDPPGARDLDDAISIDEMGDGRFKVGVHIADVSFFVQRGTALDREARQRGVSYYPGQDGEKMIPMLPRQLSENILSLLPNEDRLTVSVFLTLDSQGEIVGQAEFLRTITRSCCRLSYSQAQQIIDMEGHDEVGGVPDQVRRDIRKLHSLTEKRRLHRLNEASFDHSNNREDTDAHELIEELMILANNTVGEFLHHRNPMGTPFRTQDEPKVAHLNKWAATYGSFAKYSLALRPHLDSNDIEPDVRKEIESGDDTVFIKREVWNEILEATANVNHKQAAKLLCDPFCSPQIAVARQDLMKIQCKSQYQVGVDEPYHHTLRLRSYVHFTSPIRRYMDIEVHRLLLGLVQGNDVTEEQQFLGEEEMTALCQRATLKKDNSVKFEKESERIYSASRLKQNSLNGKFVIDKIEEHAFTIYAADPEQEQLLGHHKTIAFNDLSLSSYPICDGTNEAQGTLLKWRFRVYLAPSNNFMELREDADFIYSKIENKYRLMVHKIEGKTWMRIIDAIRQRKSERLFNLVKLANKTRDDDDDDDDDDDEEEEEDDDDDDEDDDSGGGGADDKINNAFELGEDFGHFYEITWKLKQYDAICLQLHSRLHRGMISPEEQLFKLSPDFGICLEHRKDPRGCFASSATGQINTAKVYQSIQGYIRRWKPLMEMEAATGAVRQEDGYTIKRLLASWTRAPNGTIKGQFTLSNEYCKKRQITFHRGDFTCVKILCSDENSAKSSSSSCTTDMNGESSVTWIGHGFVERCQIKEDNEDKKDERKTRTVVFLKIQQMSSEFPHELVHDSTPIECDVDVIYQPLPLRRMQEVLNKKLEESSELVQKICLGRKTPKDRFPLPPERDLSLAEHFPASRFDKLNQYQEKAVREALGKNFSLIQGPPGTGKTVTGVHIAYWFAKVNAERKRSNESEPRNAPPQVLYCGPSNKSVDVVTEYLLRISPGMKDKILRIHGKLIEETEYPIPNKITSSKQTVSEDELKIPESEIKEVSLHHFIRSESSPYAETLAEFKNKFEESKIRIEELVMEYRRLMAQAKRAVKMRQLKIPKARLRHYIKHEFPPYSEKLEDVEKKLAELKESIDKDVEKYCKVIAEAETWAIQKTGKEIILCTCSRAGSYRITSSSGCDNIQQCIIDECGMCMEPEALVPITSSNAKQFVLIGDHKQLQPIVLDRMAKTFGLAISMFERLSNRAVMLRIQYRMHPSICEFPSKYFYQDALETIYDSSRIDATNIQIWPRPQNKDLRRVFCNVEGEEKSTVISTAESGCFSKYNEEEADKAVEVAKYLVDNHKQITEKDIAILTPYRQQRKIIQDRLEEAGKDILVTTIIKSQGSEWNYVILSLVRSLPEKDLEPEPSSSWFGENLGFITDDHQINVALTRAKDGLITIGNKNLLSYSNTWRIMIEQYRKQECVVEGSQWPTPN